MYVYVIILVVVFFLISFHTSRQSHLEIVYPRKKKFEDEQKKTRTHKKREFSTNKPFEQYEINIAR